MRGLRDALILQCKCEDCSWGLPRRCLPSVVAIFACTEKSEGFRRLSIRAHLAIVQPSAKVKGLNILRISVQGSREC